MTTKCPICSKPTVAEFRPFCSARCKSVDLHRWLSESYRVPGPPVDEEEDESGKPGRNGSDE